MEITNLKITTEIRGRSISVYYQIRETCLVLSGICGSQFEFSTSLSYAIDAIFKNKTEVENFLNCNIQSVEFSFQFITVILTSAENNAYSAWIEAKKQADKEMQLAKSIKRSEVQEACEEYDLANLNLQRFEEASSDLSLVEKTFAKQWAMLMQIRMSKGKTISEIAMTAADDIPYAGSRDSAILKVMPVLFEAWEYGEALKSWREENPLLYVGYLSGIPS